MVNYTLPTAAILEQVKQEEEALLLRNSQCRSRFFFHDRSTKVVCLFLHGLTAAPYQFEPLRQVCFEAGYNVLIPRLPGHGQAGAWNKHQPPPLVQESSCRIRGTALRRSAATIMGFFIVNSRAGIEY